MALVIANEDRCEEFRHIFQVPLPLWSRVEGKSSVNLPHIPPFRGGICMGVD
jgi:hypothetical protein